MPVIAVYVCPHTVVSSLSTALDCFALANRFAGKSLFKLRKISADGRPVTTLYGELAVDGGLELASVADLLLVPAIGQDIDPVLAANSPLLRWLEQHPDKPVASVCTGAFLLAAGGALDGYRATTHWAMAEPFRQRFPRVRLEVDQLWTHDGPRFCSGGALAGIDLCLHLVQLYGSDWLARQVAGVLVVDYGRGLQSRFVPRLPLPQQQDPAVGNLQRWLEQHHAQTVTLEAMAAQLHCSPRTLMRRFKEATGLTPNDYLQRVRISAAEALLASGRQSVEQVALRVGYENRAAFAKLFKTLTGETPAAYRQRCQRA
ncbi:MAG: helix-turn-helix domain-containing protein [Fluviicoccus sp.]|uniref:GlxA family transcriptional regulator n=1 Tax=Fluviicoccus sp. TaxID=2003552 RepID=UPI0027207E5D|nr:helix-turn-helix domain-containing protein [Fluviicoccus sp.]MDO8329634.1 helix-turn-helix domain-containing protein [Fluviicoccus sp.]